VNLSEPITEKVETAIEMLKNGKAKGEDNVTSEFLKRGGKNSDQSTRTNVKG